MSTPRLIQLGDQFASIHIDYRKAQSTMSALQAVCDRRSAATGIVYGSEAWSKRRYAECGAAVHTVNALYIALEDLAEDIAALPALTIADLFVKAKAHAFAGDPAAIILDIEALAGVPDHAPPRAPPRPTPVSL